MNKFVSLLLTLFVSLSVCAETPLNYKGEFVGTAGNSELAPYYMMSHNGGVVTQGKNALLRVSAWKDLDLSKRFSYSFGVDAYAGYSNSADYLRYNVEQGKMLPMGQKPAAAVLQQLYAEIKFRGVYLSAGMKERESSLYNLYLGSGDFVQSNNARPVPQVRAGFVDFQNIPFTNGWLQIQGELAFGKYMNDGWMEDHYNYLNRYITTGVWYNYKRCFFRTKPSKPFSVTFGMQMAGQFGGNRKFYSNGVLQEEEPYDVKLKDFWDMIIPSAGGNNFGDTQYYNGNTLGSWDFIARYRLKNKTELKAYFQWPFEDGSGIAKQNGFDGVWGFEYDSKNPDAIVSGAVFEYIQFTNQSGPTHWAPNDNPDSSMEGEATGGDSYYTNFRYNGYMNLGMSQGTPFIPSIIYNKDGYMNVLDNRLKGFHLGITGKIYAPLRYRLLLSYRKSWGTYSNIRLEPVNDTSFMLEGIYDFKQVKGLSLKGQVAFDKGSLLGDNFGAGLTLSYNGLLNIFGK